MSNDLLVGDLENNRGHPDCSRVLGSETASILEQYPV